MSALTESPAWKALQQHAQRLGRQRIADLFAQDAQRVDAFSRDVLGLHLDFSKQLIDAEAMAALLDLARQQDLPQWRQRLFAGEHINNTENRAVLHMALRGGIELHYCDLDGERNEEVTPEVREVLGRMARFADSVRYHRWAGHTGKAITDVVNIGIGGSDLGPRMVCWALASSIDGPRPHFVSNVDGNDLHSVLRGLNPETTLFVIVSKTFATQETLSNAIHARAWLVSSLGEPAVERHFVAVSTQRDRVTAFGISPRNMFGFWDWVGGRYSVWSAVGLSVMLAIGPERFDELLSGAREMDLHFRDAPLADNLPVLMGLLGVWNVNFLGHASHVMAPYAQRLALFSDWAQQLVMESNGKRVTREGQPVDYRTSPVLWGTVGTNAQHAYFQMLHQGPEVHEVDFIIPVVGDHPYDDLHLKLLANCFAQSSALMCGKDARQVREELSAAGMSGAVLEAAIPHRTFPGNRPSNTLLLPRITPFSLGALMALYEHRTFVQSVIWNINAFDQWGVELGKQLTGQILDKGLDGSVDPSTAELMRRSHVFRGAAISGS